MSSPSQFEVPAQMRELAEKSVAQARQAFDSFINGARKAAAATQESAEAAHGRAKEMSAQGFEAAEQSVNAALDFAQKLTQAKSVQEAMQLQSEYMKSQLATMQQNAQEFGGKAQDVFKQAAELAKSAVQGAVDQSHTSMEQGGEKPQNDRSRE
ncbi:phasin [Methylobacterium sp. 4-46]|uniref:phasin n=1 Tax=Methylobacterium sp. (strain 4-46) TaxID=426117 RepID=UPI000A0462FB|nr:phasin [Methylobacterium sp. 4-46]